MVKTNVDISKNKNSQLYQILKQTNQLDRTLKKILADRLMRFMRRSRKYFPRWGEGGVLMDIAREVYMYDEFYCVNPPDPPPPFPILRYVKWLYP